MAIVPTDPDLDELRSTAATCKFEQRGEFVESDLAPLVTATIHPSAILWSADEREVEMKGLIDDLTKVRKALDKL